jgi:hypothetical protein
VLSRPHGLGCCRSPAGLESTPPLGLRPGDRLHKMTSEMHVEPLSVSEMKNSGIRERIVTSTWSCADLPQASASSDVIRGISVLLSQMLDAVRSY